MRYLYRIAGISVLCELPFPVHIGKESKDFIKPGSHNICQDLFVQFCPVDELEEMPVGGYWDIDRYHVADSVYYCSSPKGVAYACVSPSVPKKKLICRYIRGKEVYLNYSWNMCNIIALDALLLENHGLLLHASFVKWKEWGILFSAPSGTGKSTQADLWVQYENAEIINGDRAGLRIVDGKWNAYGLPYAGSSGIYRNESVSVKAIIVLQQAKKNHIRPLRAGEAVSYLYPELTIHRWDRTFTEQAMDLLTRLILDIPVYLLECLPDQDAVELVKHTVFNNERKRG